MRFCLIFVFQLIQRGRGLWIGMSLFVKTHHPAKHVFAFLKVEDQNFILHWSSCGVIHTESLWLIQWTHESIWKTSRATICVRTEVRGLDAVFDTCWRDRVPRICCIFRIRPGHSKLILQSVLSALRSGGCKRIGAAMKDMCKAVSPSSAPWWPHCPTFNSTYQEKEPALGHCQPIMVSLPGTYHEIKHSIKPNSSLSYYKHIWHNHIRLVSFPKVSELWLNLSMKLRVMWEVNVKVNVKENENARWPRSAPRRLGGISSLAPPLHPSTTPHEHGPTSIISDNGRRDYLTTNGSKFV